MWLTTVSFTLVEKKDNMPGISLFSGFLSKFSRLTKDISHNLKKDALSHFHFIFLPIHHNYFFFFIPSMYMFLNLVCYHNLHTMQRLCVLFKNMLFLIASHPFNHLDEQPQDIKNDTFSLGEKYLKCNLNR